MSWRLLSYFLSPRDNPFGRAHLWAYSTLSRGHGPLGGRVSLITISIYLMFCSTRLCLVLPILAFYIFLEISVGFQILDLPRTGWGTGVVPWPPLRVPPWSRPLGCGLPAGARPPPAPGGFSWVSAWKAVSCGPSRMGPGSGWLEVAWEPWLGSQSSFPNVSGLCSVNVSRGASRWP